MNNDLKILITGTLAESESVSEINKKITKIEKELDKIKLNFDIDPKVIETLKQFNNHIERYGDSIKNLNREVTTITKTYRDADGALVKLTKRLYENGEISQTESKLLSEVNARLQEQISANKTLIDQYRQKVELQKQSVQFDSHENFRGQTDVYGDSEKVIQLIERTNKHGEKFVTITRDIQQEQKNARRELLLTNKALKDLDNVTQETIVSLLKQHNVIKDQEVLGASFNSTTRQWSVTVKDGAAQQRVLKGVLDETTASLYKTSDATKQAASANLGFTEQLKIALTRVPVWMLAMTAFYGTLRTIQRMTAVIVEVDTAMTDLRKVMDETSTDFNAMLDNAIIKAKELGQTVTDVLDSFTQAAKAGLSQEEIGFLSEASLITSNVGELTSAEAAEYLISAIEQMNLAYEDSMRIIDAWNNVSNKNATTVKDLAEGWARSAATVRNFGGDIHELNAAIGALTQITRQSGNEIGNFLKSTAPRLMSTEVEETLASIGIATKNANGELRNMFDIYRDIAKALDEGRISQEQFNEAALALGGRYHITRVMALVESMRELNGEQSLFDKIMSESINSIGSAYRENATYMESLEAKQKQLTASFQEFSIIAGKSTIEPVYRKLLETLTSLLNVASGIVEKYGLLAPVFGTVTAIIMLFSTRLRNLSTYTNLYQTAVESLKNSIRTLQIEFNKTTAEINKQTAMMSGLEAATTRVAMRLSSFGQIFSGLLGGLAITAISTAVGMLIEKIIELNEKEREFRENVETSTASLAQNREYISSLVDEYEKLSRIDRNIEQEERYVELQNELAELLPVLVTGTDEHGNAILVKSEHVGTYIQQLERQLELERDLARKTAGTTIMDNREKLSDIEKDIERYELILENLQKQYDSFMEAQRYEAASIIADHMRTFHQELFELQAAQADYIENIRQAYAAWISTVEGLTESEINWIAQLGTDANMTEEEIKGLAQTVADLKLQFGDDVSLVGFTEQQIRAIEEVANAVRNGSQEWTHHRMVLQDAGIESDRIAVILGNLRNSHFDVTSAMREHNVTAENALPIYDEFGNIIGFTTDKINAQTDALDVNTAALDVNTDALDDNTNAKLGNASVTEVLFGVTSDHLEQLKNAIRIVMMLSDVENLNAQQKAILQQAIKVLENAYPHLTGRIVDNINVLFAEIDMLDQLSTASGTNAYIMMTNQDNLTKATVEASNQRILALQNEYNQLMRIVNEAAKAQIGLYGDVAVTPDMRLMMRRMDQIKAELSTAYSTRRNVLYGSGIVQRPSERYKPKLSGSSGSSKSKSGSSRSKSGSSRSKSGSSRSNTSSKSSTVKEREIEKYVTDKYAQAVENLNYRLAQSNARLNDYSTTSREYRKELENQIKLYQEQAKLASDEIKRLEKRNKTLKAQLKSMGNFNKLSAENKEKYNEIAREIDANISQINRLKKTVLDANESIEEANRKIRDSYNEIADQVINLYKELIQIQRNEAIKALEKEQEAFERAYRKRMEMLDDELEAYEKIIKEKLKLLDQEIDEEDWQKRLAEKQKERQELLAEHNRWMLDDSLEGRKRVSELKEQIEQLDVEIAEMMTNRERELRRRSLEQQLQDKREQIEKQREIEQENYDRQRELFQQQREEINQYYEDLLNDERKFAKMREDILKGNVQNIKNELNQFANFVKNNMTSIGKSISQNLLDKIKEAQSLLSQINKAAPSPSSGKSSSGTSSSKSSSSSSSKSSGSSSSSKKPTVGGKARVKSANTKAYLDSYGRQVKPWKDQAKAAGIRYDTPLYVVNMKNGYVALSKTKRVSDAIAWVKLNDVVALESGGYTGDWSGNYGKLAILHKKEQVLNKDDTENLFKSIKLLDNIKDLIRPIIKPPQLPKVAIKSGGDKIINVSMPVTIENLNGTREGAMEFLDVINRKLTGVITKA